MKYLLKRIKKILLITFFVLQAMFVQAQGDTTYAGEIAVTTQAAVDALRTTLAGKTRINGNLTIGGFFAQTDITDLSPLRNMTHITGNLIIQRNGQLNNINDLNNLQTIGGYFQVHSNDSLTALGNFPVLQSIGGYFLVGNNDSLTDLGDFPVLQTIGGYFNVYNNNSLTDLGDFPALQSIRYYFYVWNNNKLTDVGDFPALQSIGGSFEVRSNSELTDFGDFPVLQSIGGYFSVQDNDQLTDLGDFPVLQSIGGYFYVESNSKLTDLGDFPVLQSIGGFFSVYSNSELTDLGDFSVLRSIGEYFEVRENSKLTDLGDFPVLQSIGEYFEVRENSKLMDLGDFPALDSIGGYFKVLDNGDLTDLGDFPALDSIGGYFNVGYNSELTDLGDFPVLQTIGGYFGVQNNYQLTDLGDFPVLQSIGGYFGVQDNYQLTDLGDFPVLQTIGGYFGVQDNYQLTDLGDFPVLQSIGGYFGVQDNYQLTDLGDFPVLQSIGEEFYVTRNGLLTTLGNFPSLTSIGETDDVYVPSLNGNRNNVSMVIENNSRLSDCYTLTDFLPGGVHAVSGGIYINNNAGVCTNQNALSNTIYRGDITVTTQAEVDSLRTTLAGKTRIDGTLTIGYTDFSSQSDITDLTPLSNITDITGNLNIQQNGQLANLNALTHLQTIGGDFEMYNNSELTDLGDFSVLQTIGGYFYVAGHRKLSNLGDFPVLRSIEGDFFIGNPLGENRELTDLGNFPVLQTIGGSFWVLNNRKLTTFGDFPALQTIGEYFRVGGNSVTDLGDFPTLQTIGGYFEVSGNNTLTSLGNFPALQTIGEYFAVSFNDSLTTLENFPALTSIGIGAAYVPSLSENRDNISIVVEDNSSLSDCYTLTDFLPGGDHAVSGEIYINNNALGCNSGDEIIAAVPHTIMLTSHTDGDSIAIAYDEVVAQTIMFSIGGGATGWTSEITGDGFITMDTDMNVAQDTGVAITVRATPTANTGTDERIAVITLTTMGGTGAPASARVTIRQSALPDYIYLGDITVTTQTEVDTLRTTLAGKTRIDGTLTVGYTDLSSSRTHITDLTPLSNIVHITENLTIQQNGQLVNLTGLDSLQSIGGYFSVINNDSLTTLENFPILQSIGGAFLAENHDNLSTLGNFPVLQSIGEYFSVNNNAELTTLGNFPALMSIGEYFSVNNNAELTALGNFPELTSIGIGTTSSHNNVSIEVEGNLRLSGCYVLTDFLQRGSHAVSGDIYISNNESVCTDQSTLDNTIYRNSIIVETQVQVNALSDTLSGKTIIDGNLTIGYTDNRLSNIDSLTPLNNIAHITGNLIIQQNGSLVNLTGLDSLQSIGGYFSVSNNDSLTFLGDFSALTSIGTNDGKSIVVEGNSLLAYCCALTKFRSGGIHQVSGSVDISNNAMGCDSEVNCAPFVHLSGGDTLMLFDISSNVDFTLSSDRRWQLRQLDTASWVTLSVDSGGANDTLTHTSVRVEHLRNEVYNARMVKFSIVFPDETSSYTPDTLTIIQQKNQTPKIELTSHTDGDTIKIAYDNTDSITLNFTIDGSTTEWKASIIQIDNFIVPSLSNGTKQQTSITIAPKDTESRTATITLSTTGHDERYPTASVSLTITQEAVPTIKVNSINGRTSIDSISIAYDATDSITIKFNVGGSATGWESVNTNSDFITLFPKDSTDQKGNGISIMATPSANENTIPRTATITLSTTGQKGTPKSVSLTITQEAIPVLQITSKDTTIIHDETDSIPIKFYVGGSATGWTSVNTNFNFVKLGTTMNDNQTDTVTIMAKPDENMDVEERTDTIILSTTGNGDPVSDTFTITQKAAPRITLTSPSDISIPHHDIMPRTISFTLEGNFTGWESSIIDTANFITLNTPNDSTSAIEITPSVNENTIARTATITLRTMGEGTPDSVSLTITQEAMPTIMLSSYIYNNDTSVLESNGDNIVIAHDHTNPIIINFMFGGSATDWKDSITYSPGISNFIESASLINNGTNGTINITPKSKNTNTASRTATIKLSTTGQIGDSASVSLTIIQEGKPVLDIISNRNDIIAYDATDSIPITFFVGGSATGWESVNTNPDFITLSSKSNIAETGDITIMASPMENMGNERIATITLRTTGQKGDSVSRSLTITQEAVPTIKVNSTDQITSSIDSISIAHDDTLPKTINFTVGGSAEGWKSDITYEGTDSSFITLSLDSGMAQTNITITATPSANEDTILRKATITLSTTGQKGTPKSVSFTITQEAIPVLQITSNDSVNIIHDETDSIPIKFYVGGSAKGWTSMNSNLNFITLPLESGTDTGNITIMAKPDENMNVEERTDTIILSTTGHIDGGASVSDIFTITQKAAPEIKLTSPGDTSISIPHHDIMPRTISFALGGSATGWESSIIDTENFITLNTPNDSTRAITITPSVNENTIARRTATITLRTMGEGTPDSVSLTITQEAMPTIMLSSYNDGDSLLEPDGDIIVIAHDHMSPIPIKFMFGGSATGWKDSITYSPGISNFIESASLINDGTNGTINITPKSKNTNTTPRTATITLSTTGQKGTPKSVSLTITQEAIPVLQITSKDTTIIHDETDSIPIKFYVGGSAKGWTSMNSNLNFITLPLESGTDTGNITIMAKPDENMNAEERTDTIILSTIGHIDGGASVSDIFTITQKAAPEIKLTSPGDTSISIPHHDIMPRTISFALGGSATGWESSIIDTENFITLNTPNDSTRAITITPSVNENTIARRTATITLRTMGEGTPDSVSLTITQEAMPTIMLSSYNDGDSLLEPDGDIIVIAHDHMSPIPIKFMFGGSATGWKDSITYSPGISNFIESASLINDGTNGTINITPKSKNTNTTPRTATITLSTTGQKGTPKSVSLTIRQEGKPVLDLFSNRNDTIAYDANTTDSIPITFFVGGSATGWESVNTNPDFITLFLKDSIAQTDTITIMASPMENMGNERIATITLRTTGQKGTADSVSLTITQEAVPNIELIPNDTDIIAYDATNSIPITFNVGGSSATGWKSDITYEGTNSTFITLSLDSGMAQTNITITATPSANEDTILRKATIKLSTTGQKGTPKSVSFTITQEAIPVLQITDNDSVNIIHDATDSIPIKFYVGGSAKGWTSVNSNLNFITLGTTMNDNQTDTVTIMASPSANTDTTSRTATIILSTTGQIGDPVSDIFTITQKAAPRITLTSPSDISIPNDEIMPRTISFTLKGSASGITYMPPEDTSFITLDMLNDGTRAITITPTTVNTTTEERTETITLRTTGSGGTPDSVSLTITQEAMPTIMLTSRSDGETITIGHDSLTSDITFTVGGGAMGWMASSDQNFVTLDTTSGDLGADTVTATFGSENTTRMARTATIMITTMGRGLSVSETVTITQEAVPTIIVNSISETNSIERISIAHDDTLPKTINFTVGGSAKGWTDSIIYTPDNVDFIMIKRQNSKDDGTRVIMITPEVNTTTEERTATITLSTTGQKGTPKSVSLTITQEAIPVLQITSKDTTIIHDETDSIPITFNVGGSATGWTSKITDMDINSNFITLSTTMNDNQTDTVTIMAIPEKNSDIEERTDTIILSTIGHIDGGASVSDIFTITQKAAPRITLTSRSDGGNIDVAHDDTIPRTISFALGGSATGWESSIIDTASFITLGTLNDGTRAITITPTTVNTTTEERTETITLRTTGSGGTPDSVSLTITQEAMPTIMLSSYNDGDSLLEADGYIIVIAHDHMSPIPIKFMFGGSATDWKDSITYSPGTPNFVKSESLTNEGTNGSINITPKSKNTDTTSRTAIIKLRTTGQDGTPASVSLTIRQEGKPALDPISNHNDIIAYDANTTDSIPITFFVGGSATGWESVNTNPDFITLFPKDSIAQTDTITIMASPMENMGNERIATITLRTTGQIGTADSVSLTITQETFPTIKVNSIDQITSSIDSISITHDDTLPKTINFTVGGSAKGWTDSIIYTPDNVDFIMLQRQENKDDGTRVIKIIPSVNTTTEERTTTVTLSTTGQKGTPKSVSFIITQEAIPVLEITSKDATIIHDATDPIPIKFYVGGSAAGWGSDISYTGTTSEFITLSPKDSMAQTDTIIIMASPSANTDTTSRTARVVLSTKGNGDPVSDLFTITQKAAPRITLTSHSDRGNIDVAHDDTIPRTISFALGGSATGWESDITYAPENDTSIMISQNEGTDGNIIITPSANDTTKERTATITLRTTGPGQTPDSVSLMITQEAIPAIRLSTYNNGDSLLKSDGDNIDIAHDHTSSIPIEFNVGGSATGWKSSITYPIGTSEEDKFINSSLEKNGADPNITIPIKNKNTGTTSRTATITLSTTGQDGTPASVSLTIRQEGKPALDLTSGDISIDPNNTASIPIEFTVEGSATGWESIISYLPAKDTFITLSPKDSMDQTGLITIMASPMENTDIKERTAMITLKTTGHDGAPASVSLTITQRALPNDPTIELNFIDSISIDSISIAHDDTIPKDINFTVGGSARGWESEVIYMDTESEFIDLDHVNNNGIGNIPIMATPSANEDTIPRTATITLSTTGHDGDAVSVSLTITQEAKPVLKLTSNDNDTIAHDAIDFHTYSLQCRGQCDGLEQ